MSKDRYEYIAISIYWVGVTSLWEPFVRAVGAVSGEDCWQVDDML